MKKLCFALMFAVCVACAAPPPAAETSASKDLAAWQAQAQNVTITRDDWGIPHVHGKTDADTVFGFYAPAGTPTDVVTRLNREINRILGTQPVRDRIAGLGGEALPLTPTEFAAKTEEDSKRFGAIIKERKIIGD